MSSSPEVSVVIVAYRSEDWLPRCLGSLPAAIAEHDHEVIVVDNDSPDDSAGVVRRSFPEVRLLEPGDNLGFARAVNLAAREARGEWLVLLNPDTESRPGSLDALVRFAAAHPGAGIVGGRTVSEDGTVDPSSCWGLPSLWSRVCFATGLSTVFRGNRVLDPESLGSWQRDTVREVGMVTGCLVAMRRDLFLDVGGFDERFWMYGEDADLNMRIRDRGLRPTITPAAEVIHAVGASATAQGSRRVQVMRSKVTLDLLHAPAWQRSLRIGLLQLGVALRAGLARALGRDDGWRETWADRADWIDGYDGVA